MALINWILKLKMHANTFFFFNFILHENTIWDIFFIFWENWPDLYIFIMHGFFYIFFVLIPDLYFYNISEKSRGI